jgi:hypothetical protein
MITNSISNYRGGLKMADKPQEEFGGKGGSGDVTGKENLFTFSGM